MGATLSYIASAKLSTYVACRSPYLSWPRRRERVAPSAEGEAPRSRVSPHWIAPTYTPEDSTIYVRNLGVYGAEETSCARDTPNYSAEDQGHAAANTINVQHTEQSTHSTVNTRNGPHTQRSSHSIVNILNNKKINNQHTQWSTHSTHNI